MKVITPIMGLPRSLKQVIVFATDTLFVITSVWLAISLRYETFRFPEGVEWSAYFTAYFIALPIFVHAGLYRSIFRYSGFSTLSTVTKACVRYGVIYCLSVYFLMPVSIPRSIGILQPLLLLIALGSSRAMARFLFHQGSVPVPLNCVKEKLLIYGAGSAGIQIAGALQHNPAYNIEGFIDDDSSLHDNRINGVMIYSVKSVSHLIKCKGITSILIAVPSASRSRRQQIYCSLKALGIHIRTLPGIEMLANGKVDITDIREIEIEDLLGRDPVPPYPELFARCIKGKNVLVTGAGGSIGSELCRQILIQRPLSLVLLEHSEYNLYTIHKELEERIKIQHIAVKLVPLLGDVTDRRYMEQLCVDYRPHTIYHAAAFKHVPLVEYNPGEGLRNNVFGTLSVAEAAKKSGAKHVVLVSTDKAVRPTNVMGASKRIAELILQAFAFEQDNEGTCFSMVRFGNVLGSSGSVVPLFKHQIKNGGPVTVTHQEVTRYFMTIPEAAQLVIQSGAMATGGDVFLLDMGEPVRIIDLARRMIDLSGLTVKDQDNLDGDIEIVVTGLRPGEKLYEELLIADNPIPTIHPRIFKAHETFVPITKLMEYLDTLEIIITDGQRNINELKTLLKTIVKGYNKSENDVKKPEISIMSQSVIYE
jgi:FlaA1/EpsC-like NDP-sugar epimerase